MDTFQLHERLRADCHVLGPMGDRCLLLLHRDALIPWYIVVPETVAPELHLLSPALRAAVTRVLDALACFVEDHHGAERVNVAAIGNLVPQLHLHVVGRSTDDICWPGVVWGRLPDGPAWTDVGLAHVRQGLVAAGLQESA